MARQPTKTAAAKKAAATPPKEDTVTTTATAPADEATAQNTPVQDNTAAPQTAEVVDTKAFDDALASALAEMDQSTGTLAEAQLAPVVKAYQELDGSKAKAKVRAGIEQGVKEALDPASGNIPHARALNTIRQEITKAKGGGKKSEATPSDPTEAFVQQVVALQLAYGQVTQNVPDGVAEDWQVKANALAEKTVGEVDTLSKYTGEGEEPEVSPLARRALKLATGKVKSGSTGTRTPFTGTRRDIGKHILEAFADKASGDFLTVAQIVSHKSSEYGNEAPSPGAVSARLFPRSGKCTLEGIEPVDKTDSQPKGARKL
jgi:hypothetical protein